MAKNLLQSLELFEKICEELPDAKPGKMFGAACIKAPNGKAVALFYKEQMVFKLNGTAETEALSLDGSEVFDPMGSRPMGGWIQVPFDYADRWHSFAIEAMKYVSQLPPNEKRKKK